MQRIRGGVRRMGIGAPFLERSEFPASIEPEGEPEGDPHSGKFSFRQSDRPTAATRNGSKELRKDHGVYQI